MVKYVRESDGEGKGAVAIKIAGETYYTTKDEIQKLHDEHDIEKGTYPMFWATSEKSDIVYGEIQRGWTFHIYDVDNSWLKRHGFQNDALH